MDTPLNLKHSVPLASHTTLGVGGVAKLFVEVGSNEEVERAIALAKTQGESWVVIGGGSNILVSDAGYDGLVIKMSIEGITLVSKDDVSVLVSVGAGVNFDTFVEYTVAQGWWGLENLSSIPGTVGATPVQNVGAYGAEISQTLVSVEVYDTLNDAVVTLSKEECTFGYRTSLFKVVPGRYIILSANFSLSLIPSPQCTYADLAKRFAGEETPSIQAIRQAVQEIRSQKFPDWTVVGTAGSFFKNPIVHKEEADAVLEKYPDLPHYAEGQDMVKFPLGYILDKVCGLKGYKKDKVRLYERQALVVVVERGATASEVEDFAKEVTQKVFAKTGIKIEKEVTLI